MQKIKLATLLMAISVILFHNCSQDSETQDNTNSTTETDSTKYEEDNNNYLLTQGKWIGSLRISKKNRLPFFMEIKKDSVYFINAEEKIGALIEEDENLVRIKMPIFDSEFKFSINDEGIYGYWYNKAKGDDYAIDFTAKPVTDVENRFEVLTDKNPSIFDGIWETTFSPENDPYKAVGIFVQKQQEVTGTFLTETGDFRYLSGNVVGDSMYLSAFDGSHAFLFEAKLKDEEIDGIFYSGNHYQTEWKAHRNDNFELTDPDSLTKIQIGKELSFSLPGLKGNEVTYPSQKYSNKVTIIQILGSWCPNCMDETEFLAKLYNQYQEDGLEIIGISFENPKSLEGKVERVKELKEYFNANYDFCIGGDASKEVALETLPALSNVLSFPTTLFIDKDGKVRKIHTGFYGPGTGAYYLKFVNNTKKFIEQLLSE